MTFEELSKKHADTQFDRVFTVDLPRKMWAYIDGYDEDSSLVELKYTDADTHFTASIGLGVKSNENIDKLLDGLKGE